MLNDRLEIASRLMAAARAQGYSLPTPDALWEADALIAEEARTRKPEAADAMTGVFCRLVEAKGHTHLVPIEVADELAKLREVGRELAVACDTAVEIIRDSYGEDEVDNPSDCQAVNVLVSALAAARDLGLGGAA